MPRHAVRVLLLSLLAVPLGAQDVHIPNVDSIVRHAMRENAGAEGGMLIGTVMSDTGVQRVMKDDPHAREEIRQAVHEFAHSFRSGNEADHELAQQAFLGQIKQATGRDFSGSQIATTVHIPRVDVNVPGVNVHIAPQDVQVPPVPPMPGAPPAPPAPPARPAVQSSQVLSDSLKSLVDRARHDPSITSLPSLEDFTAGPRTVNGENHGDVATVGGTLTIAGIVDGDAAAVAGDIVLLPGAIIRGDATAVGGEVRENGGKVLGEVRSTSGKIGPISKIVTAHTPPGARHEFRLSLAFLAVMLIFGVGVLTFASDPLEAAGQAVSEQFGRALGYGIVGALAVLPLLAVLLIAAILTLIGILFTPVIVTVYALVVLGIILVGFFAVAETTGRAVYRRREGLDPLTERGAKLRALVTGIGIYGGMWVIAAIFGGLPVIGVLLHAIASAVTTIVLLVGCGAVLLSRRDARNFLTIRGPRTSAPVTPSPDLLWQTPTPIGGVAAARRPTPPPPTSGPAA
jgi:hypothetical protein